MNVAIFKEAQQAYERGDYKAALEGFTVCARDIAELPPSDQSKFFHLIGNCYVKNGDPHAAAAFYTKALAGSPEKRKPSLYVNLGTALLGTKDYNEALNAFTRALDYPIYTTPYKAYSGVGAAQLKLGNMLDAGVAYREAALDPTNPSPGKALVNLGVCFMELGRSEDAITSYEAAFEFDLDAATFAKGQANMGQAYMAQGRVQKALNAFDAAAANGYSLPSMAQHDYDIARTLKTKLDEKVPGILDTGFIPNIPAAAPAAPAAAAPSEPAEMVPSESGHLPVYGEDGFDPFAPQTQAMDPVSSQELDGLLEQSDEDLDADVLDASGEAGDADIHNQKTQMLSPVADEPCDEGQDAPYGGFSDYESVDDEYGIMAASNASEVDEFTMSDTHMPSPEDTEFFDITEQQIADDFKAGRRRERRARGLGLKIAITIVVLCILVAGAACAGYALGYGYPLQEDVAEGFFGAVQSGGDTSQYWADDVASASRESQQTALVELTSYNVEAVQRGMSQTTVYVKGTLQEGGQVDYELVMSRKGVSWAIEYVELYFPSQQ